MNTSQIKIFITGGTIDDLNYERDVPQNHQSLITGLLERARITPDYDVEVLMQKDSRVISDKDREIILERCRNCTEDEILITHGTYTMPGTAKYLGNTHLDKTIVLFGAHIPANRDNSDALFNLGTAFIACQLLPKGVYILMNGKVFTWDNVKKDFPTGYFKEE